MSEAGTNQPKLAHCFPFPSTFGAYSVLNRKKTNTPIKFSRPKLMDPFSITVGALGITEFAVSSIVRLHTFINGLAEAKEVVQDIASNLEGIQQPLASLRELSLSGEAIRDLKKTGVVEAVNRCGDACAKFNKSLEKWTKHSPGTKLSLRDRLSVGVWNQEKIRTFRTQVQSCQANVQFAVTSTQLIVQLRSRTDRKELEERLLDLQTNIEKHLVFVNDQHAEAQRRKEELQQLSEDEEDDNDAQRTLAIKEVEEQSRLLEDEQVSSGVILSQVQAERTGQKIGDVITSGNSTAWVGMPASVVGRITQQIGNVKTTEGSVARVGVFN
ncbi:hypothetical protein F5X98DRAFT_359139 [Xylaria grammica]|nr:hypothetical protein F5X98DRAFT_359139 [Xylaria grammica]